MKKFIAGLLAGMLVAVAISVYAETTSLINVISDRVKVVINGQSVDMTTILYESKTYVPLRAVSGALGLEVTWDEKNSTAYVNLPEDLPEITPMEMDYINKVFLAFEEIQVLLDDIYETVHSSEAPFVVEDDIEHILSMFMDIMALTAPDSLAEYKEKVDKFCDMNIDIFYSLADYISENPDEESGFIEFFDSLYDTEFLLDTYLEADEALFNFLGQRSIG